MAVDERSKIESLIQESKKAAGICWVLINAMHAEGLDDSYTNSIWVVGEKLNHIEEELQAIYKGTANHDDEE